MLLAEGMAGSGLSSVGVLASFFYSAPRELIVEITKYEQDVKIIASDKLC